MLAFRDQGKGSVLVFLHAFPLHSGMWENQIRHFSKEHRVIAPDLPGFGNSEPQIQPSIPAMARDTAMLLDHLQIKEPVFMAGLSMGGYAALEFFRQFPDRVKALGFFATRATADSPEARENRFRSIDAIERFGIEPYVKKIIKSQLGKTTLEKCPEAGERALKIMISNSQKAAVDALKAMAARGDSSDLLAKIKFPVLIAAGEEDVLSPPAEMRGMHEKIPGSVFQVVPGSGHLISLEQERIFNETLETFLKKYHL